MWLRNLIGKLEKARQFRHQRSISGSRQGRAKRGPSSRRLATEFLEDRRLLDASPWQTATVDATDDSLHASLQIVDGQPAISYFTWNGTALRYVRATDASGTTWGSPVSIDSIGNEMTSMQVVNGKPAIAYYRYQWSGHGLRYVQANDQDGATWPSPTTVDGASPSTGYDASLQIVSGNPAISYYDPDVHQLLYLRATDANGGGWGTRVVIDGSTTGYGYRCNSLQMVNGSPAISYFDTTDSRLKFVRATDSTGSTWGTPISVDSPGHTSYYASMQVVNGMPAISYYDATNGDLVFVRASNANGTAWGTPVSIDTTGDVGSYTSLKVVNGKPAISYYDNTNTRVKYAYATDADGTTWAAPMIVDTTVAAETSLTMLADGNPAVAYYDSTNTQLKYAYVPKDLALDLTGGGAFTLELSGSDVVLKQGATTISQAPLDWFDTLTIEGSSGDDTLTLDFTNGSPIPGGGIAFNGNGGENDTLEIQGGDFTEIVESFDSAHDGQITLVDLEATHSIHYTGLAPVLINAGTVDDIIFNLPTLVQNPDVVLSDDTLTLPPVANTSQISGSTFEATTFTNPANSLTINLGPLGDTIALQVLDPAFNAITTIQGGALADTINVQATTGTTNNYLIDGGGSAGDAINVGSTSNTLDDIATNVIVQNAIPSTGTATLTINDGGSSDPKTVTVTSAQVTSFDGAATATIGYTTGVTSLICNGGSGGNTVNVQSTAAAVTTTVNAGTGNDTINVSSDAPTNSGDLADIAGTLNLNLQAGTGQRITISDFGEATTANDTMVVTDTAITGFAGATNATTINYSAGGGSTNTLTLEGSNTAGFDVFNVWSTSALFTTTINANGSGDMIVVSSDAPIGNGNLAGIAGTLNLNLGAGLGIGISDSGETGTANTNVVVTNIAITGFAGPANGTTINYSAAAGSLGLQGSKTLGDTFNVRSTNSLLQTGIAGGGGNDTINVSSDAPTNAGTLSGILGELGIDSGDGNDTLNISDSGHAAGHTYTIGDAGSGTTQISRSGIANISYANPALEVLTLRGSSAGPNTYNVDVTSASTSTTISDGTASTSGTSTWNIQGDALQSGAAHTFNGNAGVDTFNLNFAAGESIPSAAGTSLTINGNAPANEPANRDAVNVNANALGDGPRTVTFAYTSTTDGNLTVGNLGTDSTIALNTVESVQYTGDADNNDQVTVVDTNSAVQPATVTPGANGATYTRNGGVSSTEPGPDLSLSGLDDSVTTPLTVDGADPDNSTFPPGDELVYDGPSPATKEITDAFGGDITAAGVIGVHFTNYEAVRALDDQLFDDVYSVPSDGDPNRITLRRDSTGAFLEILLDADTTDGNPTPVVVSRQLMASINSLTIDGSDDGDTLVIDDANGLPAFAGSVPGVTDNPNIAGTAGLLFNGGSGSNALEFILNQAGTDQVYAVGDGVGGGSGVGTSEGEILTANAGLSQSLLVYFQALEPITASGTPGGTLTVIGDTNANVIDIQPGASGFNLITATNPVFESYSWAANAFTALNVYGMGASDTITLVGLDPAEASLATIEISGDTTGLGGAGTDASADTLNVLSLPAFASLSLVGDSDVNAAGGGGNVITIGNTAANFGDGTGGLAPIDGPISVFGGAPLFRGGTLNNTLQVDDSGETAGQTVTLTDTTMTSSNMTNGIVALPVPGYVDVQTFNAVFGQGSDTVNIRTTNGANWYDGTATVYSINTDPAAGLSGDDTVNISSTAPAVNGNGTLSGNLNGILGKINLNTGGNSTPADLGDRLNISNFGGAAKSYTLDVNLPGAGNTRLQATGVADIVYDANGTAGQLEHFNLVGSDVGDNSYFINATTATRTNRVADGDQTPAVGTNNATFVLNGDALSAANQFQGFDGNDAFTLNILWDLGSISSASLTSLTIEGNATTPALGNPNRDSLTINDNSGYWRYLNFHYLTQAAGDMDITGFAQAIQARTMETIVSTNASDRDYATITGTPGNDEITVAPLSATSALVFLGNDSAGGGWENDPASPGFFATFPGVAGGAAGPDLYLQNIYPWSNLTVAGGNAASGNDQLYVDAPSEQPLAAPGGDNPFGFGPGVLIPGFGVGNAWDTIHVNDWSSGVDAVTINNNVAGGLLGVAMSSASDFQQTTPPPGEANKPGLIVNSGFETTFDPATGVADDISAMISPTYFIRVNGGDPGLTLSPLGAPQGDQLNVWFSGDINVFSDDATTPNVTLQDIATPNSGITFSSIERTQFTPGTGVVNILGDNNDANVEQNDVFKVVGEAIPTVVSSTPPVATNAFSLQIGGDKTVPGGPVDLSAKIYFTGVRRINAFGGDNAGGAGHNPEVTNTGVDELEVTPYADNTPLGWGIETYWDEGDPITDGDLVTINGVFGVAENLVVQPSAWQAGQVIDINAATGTPIAVVNYSLNTNIIVNGSSPAGTAGDTDTLTLRGTDPASPGTSGNEDVIADFAAVGDATHPMVRVYDAGATPPAVRPTPAEVADTAGSLANIVYSLQNFSNFDTIRIETLAGDDSVSVVGRNDGSLTVDVDGGDPSGSDALILPGTMAVDTFTINAGMDRSTGNAQVLRNPAASPTTVNYTQIETITVDGGTSGLDQITVNGTGGDDVFTFAASSLQTNVTPTVTLTNLSASTNVALNGQGGDDHFAITPQTGLNISVDAGAPSASDVVVINGTSGADTIRVTPTGPSSASVQVGLLPAVLVSNTERLIVDGQGGADNLIVVLPNGANLVDYEFDSFSFVGSVNVNHNGQPWLPLEFQNIDLGLANAVAIDGTTNAGTNTLLYGGRTEVDQIKVDSAGLIADAPLSLPVTTTGIADLILLGRGGNDVFDIAADHPFNSIIVTGGSPVTASNPDSGGDMLVVRGAALRAETITVTPNPWIDSETYVRGTGTGAIPTSTISTSGVGRIYYLGADSNDTLVVDPGEGTHQVRVDGGRFTGSPLVMPGPYDRVTSDSLPEVQGHALDTLRIAPLGAGSVAATFVTRDLSEAKHYEAALDANDTLVIEGNDGSADNYTVTKPAGAVAVADAASGKTVTATLTTLGRLEIGTLGGDDKVDVDVSGTDLIGVPIVFDGGGGSDLLLVRGAPAVLAGAFTTTATYTVGPLDNQGRLVEQGIGASTTKMTIDFANLEPTIDLVPGTLTVNGTNGDNAINYNVGPNSGLTNTFNPSGLVTGQVSVDGFEPIEFANKTGLTINGQSGGDTFSLHNATTPFGLTGITVNGNDTTSGDALIVNGVASQVTVATATNQISGVTGTSGGVLVSYGTIESLTVNAGTATNNLAVTGSSSYEYTPGTALDAGTLQTDTLPIAFTGLAGGETLDLAGTSLVAHGTDANNVFDLSSGGLTVDSRVTITRNGLTTVTLDGLAGDDAFTVTNGHGYTTVNINGGSPSSTDVVTLAGDATSVTVQLGTSPVSTKDAVVTNGGLGTVNLSGVEVANVTGTATRDARVDGSAEDDELTYQPSGANAGTISKAGLNLMVNLSNVGNLTVDGVSGDDRLTFLGTAGADTFTAISSATVAITGLQGVETLSNMDALTVRGQEDADTFAVTAGAMPILIDGGDPIATLPGDSLNITLAAPATVTANLGPEPDEGSFAISGNQPVSYDHIESLSVTAPASPPALASSLIVNGTNADNDITVVGTGADDFTVSIDGGPAIQFVDIPSLTVNGLAGDDDIDIDVNALDLTSFVVYGGLPSTNGDIVTVTGAAGLTNDNAIWAPTANTPDEGRLTIGPQASQIDLRGVERLIYDGEGENETLTVQGTAAADRFTHTPGAARDAGAIVIDDGTDTLLGIEYVSLGLASGAVVRIDGLAATDTLAALGTPDSDVMVVSFPAPNNIQASLSSALGAHVPLESINASVERFEVRSLEGDDNIDLTAPAVASWTSLALFGGGPSAGSDTLNLTSAVGSETIKIRPDASQADDQDVLLSLSGTVDVTGVELITVSGQSAETDELQVDAGRGDHWLRVDNGSLQGMDRVVSDSLPEIQFTALDTFQVYQSTSGTGSILAAFVTGNLQGAKHYETDLESESSLIIEGRDGLNDRYTVTHPAGSNVVVQDVVSAVTVTDISFALPVGRLQINTLGGDDLVTVDDTAGLIGVPITYDGGTNSDTLLVTGSTAVEQVEYFPGSDVLEGRLTYDLDWDTPDTSDMVVDFINLEPVIDLTAKRVALTVYGTNADNAINYIKGPNSGSTLVDDLTTGLVSVDGFETLEFANFTGEDCVLEILGLAGDDVVNLNNATVPTGLDRIWVEGNDPTASDKVIVNGTTGFNDITVANFTADGARVTGAQPIRVDVLTAEQLIVNGQGGNDTLTVETPDGGDEVEYFPAVAEDAGSISITRAGTPGIQQLLPFAFEDLGAGGDLTFANNDALALREDRLVVAGTDNDDVFSVTAGGTVQVVKPSTFFVTLPMATPGVSEVGLLGLDGDDKFGIAGDHPFELGVDVEGGNPSASDVLNFLGSGTDTVTVDLAASTVQETGFGPVSFTGAEIVNVDADGEDLDVDVTTGDDLLEVWPAGPEEGRFQANGISPVVNFSNVDTFTVDLLAPNPAAAPPVPASSGDCLVVNATTASDTITVNGYTAGPTFVPAVTVKASNETAARITVNYANVEALTVNGQEGDDTFNLTASPTATISIDGGDPIGVTPGDQLNILAGLPTPQPVKWEPGPLSDQGGFLVGTNQRISYIHIEGLGVNNAACALITGTNGDDDITVIARTAQAVPPMYLGADGVQDFTTSVNGAPEILWLDTANLYVDGLSGDDDITVRAPALDGSGSPIAWGVHLRVAGGPPSAPLHGDRLVLETPGANKVQYTPLGSDSGQILLYSTGGVTADTTIDVGSFTAVCGNQTYVSSPGGVEHLVYDGEGANDALIVVGTGGDDTITHTPGQAFDEGQFRVNSTLAIDYQNLGATGSETVDGALGGSDLLVLLGTNVDDTFTVAGTASIGLNSRLPVATSGVESYSLKGLEGDDTFAITPVADISIRVEGDDPGASDTVNFTRVAAGATQVVVNLDATPAAASLTQTITQPGFAAVTLSGIEIANVDAATGDLYLSGTRRDDLIAYTPTSTSAGTFTAEGIDTVFNFAGVPQATNEFVVTGGGTGWGGPTGGGFNDKVLVNGTTGSDRIRVNSPARTAQVSPQSFGYPPAVLEEWRDVTLYDGSSVLPAGVVPLVSAGPLESVEVDGDDGDDTFHVVPALAVGNGLFIKLDGGSPRASDALVITNLVTNPNGSTVPVALAATDFVVDSKSRTPDAGNILVFRNTGSIVRMPNIAYENMEVVAPNVALQGNGDPNLLVLGPDNYEENEYRATSAYLGSGTSLNVTDLAIFPNASEHVGVPADQDWFRVVAAQTGTLDVQVYYKLYAGLLPAAGNLTVEIRDNSASANVIATSTGGAAQFGAVNTLTGNARVRIPAVAGQTYYVHVFGTTTDVVNGYDMTVNNDAPPVAQNLELRDNPVGDPPPANSDSGRSQFDNVTRVNTPTLVFRLDDGIFLHDLPGNPADDSPPAGVIPIPFRAGPGQPTLAGYAIAVFDEGATPPPGTQTGTAPQVFLGFATATAQQGVYQFTTPVLTNGSHFLTARVQMIDPATPTQTGFGDRSLALEIVVDTVIPPVSFGLPTVVDDGLAADSDTGVSPPNRDTIIDKITSDTTPAFWGRAEADAIVRLYADANKDGILQIGTDVFLGQATAIPLDGTNQEPDGYWEIQSIVDLNDPDLFPAPLFGLDGLRTVFVTAEDVAGNVNAPAGAADLLRIMIDTQGPVIDAVYITGESDYDLFDPKPSTDGPTPLVYSLTIDFTDLPERVSPDFLYDALKEDVAKHPGHYRLVGDANGVIAIKEVKVTQVIGPDATRGLTLAAQATVELVFFEPLPDDRFTLTISDAITDPVGNALDGETNAVEPQEVPLFPTGDRVPGGTFVARFTIDTRPEIGTWSAGSVYVDINGNFTYDPTNLDATNRDFAYVMGFTSDDIFCGNFAGAGADEVYGTADDAALADGFGKLGAYGMVNKNYRWVIDDDNDGVGFVVLDPANINGLPVSGSFDGDAANGDEVGVFDGTAWHLDTNHDFKVDFKLTTALRGYPITGDFDGDGFVDLATYKNGAFYFDLTGGVENGWDGVLDDSIATTFDEFIGTNERPVAADMDQDGISDVGLWVPDRSGVADNLAEWYILVSNDPLALERQDGTVVTLKHDFSPTPLGDDLFAQFGDEYALPILGNFDPPAAAKNGTPSATLSLSGTSGDDTLIVAPGEAAGTWTVSLKGETQTVSGDSFSLSFDALGGNDTVTFTGTDAGAAQVELGPEQVSVMGPGYAIQINHAETVSVVAAGDGNAAVFHDTTAADTFTAAPRLASLTGGGVSLSVAGASSVSADSQAGGDDTANLTGSDGADTFLGTSGSSSLQGTGFTIGVNSFRFVYAKAAGGAGDVAQLYGTAGRDTLVAYSSTTSLSGTGYLVRAKEFDKVRAFGQAGDDTATLTGSPRNDQLISRPNTARFRGTGFDVEESGFEHLAAYSGGGVDTALLYDSAGNDRLNASRQYTKLVGTGYDMRASQFASVCAYASTGMDLAYFTDSPGNDTFYATATYARLSGASYLITARAFDGAYAYGTAGGVDSAKLYGSSGKDVFTITSAYTQMSGTGYISRVNSFEITSVYGQGRNDRAVVHDAVLEGPLTGVTPGTASTSSSRVSWLSNFMEIQLKKQGTVVQTLQAVDQVFAAHW